MQSDTVKDDTANRVARICDHFDAAARGEHVAWSISTAMHSIACQQNRLSADQCQQLLEAIVRAHDGAQRHVAQWIKPQQISVGMSTVAMQVVALTEQTKAFEVRGWPLACDVNAYARMFRNLMHNLSLAEEIADRGRQRRDGQIQQLLLEANRVAGNPYSLIDGEK